MGVRDLLRFASIGRTLEPGKIKNVVVPGRSGSAGGASVVFPSPGDLFKKVSDDGIL